jgi:hypothetical protein
MEGSPSLYSLKEITTTNTDYLIAILVRKCPFLLCVVKIYEIFFKKPNMLTLG